MTDGPTGEVMLDACRRALPEMEAVPLSSTCGSVGAEGAGQRVRAGRGGGELGAAAVKWRLNRCGRASPKPGSSSRTYERSCMAQSLGIYSSAAAFYLLS